MASTYTGTKHQSREVLLEEHAAYLVKLLQRLFVLALLVEPRANPKQSLPTDAKSNISDWGVTLEMWLM